MIVRLILNHNEKTHCFCIQESWNSYCVTFSELFEAGYIPYRVGNHSMAALDPAGDSYWRTVAALKAALDPQGILAPGRYQPGVAAHLG